ncbi:hypothetical protein EUGRSUZ_E01958 [Eucalyptus grandis]|uniref:Uncharacterized protein n=2 Tax=Eucalyptus grandis TaxID=71139 RepID=A0ACC3KVC6_EUCGR|nr:hypothetical protein EUGRSUZ_E01958 [Eucalyptus grandis]
MRQLGCLNWEEDAQVNRDTSGNGLAFEDCTTRFFPPAPRAPCMLGLVPGETGLTDDGQDSFVVLSNSSKQCFNILCSGDEDGVLCFSIFGVFPIGIVVSLLSVLDHIFSSIVYQIQSMTTSFLSHFHRAVFLNKWI